MRSCLSFLSLLSLVAVQVAIAKDYKCDQPDGVGAGYTIGGSEAHQCSDGTFCYQVNNGIYCGVGSGDTVQLAEEAHQNMSPANDLPAQRARALNLCAKDKAAAVCRLADGEDSNYYRCVDDKVQAHKCGGETVCYDKNGGVFCGASNKASGCTNGAVKCASIDGHGPDFTRCIGGEQVAATCGVGLACYQEGPFHISCGPHNEDNTRVEHPIDPRSFTDLVDKALSKDSADVRKRGLNLMEVELDYNPDDFFEFKKDYTSMSGDNVFEKPSAFARDMASYGGNSYASYSSSNDMQYPTAVPYKNSYATQQPSYQSQTGYQSQPGGYQSQPGGYQSQPGGYQSQSGGYQSQPGGYQSQPGGYQSQPGGYQTQQPSYPTQPPYAPYAAIVPETVPFSQLLNSIQAAVQYAGQPPPVYSQCPPPISVCCSPEAPCSGHSTHTVYISVETNYAKPTCHTTVCCTVEPECETTNECEHEHKHKHKHKHKHSHKHSHKHKDKCSEDKHKPCVSELDENDCFGRAVLSIVNDDNEGVATIGKKLFAAVHEEESDSDSDNESDRPVMHNAAGTCESCPTATCEPVCNAQTTHTAYESVETGCTDCTCKEEKCKGCKCKGCKCGKHCTCGAHCTCCDEDSYHTALVTIETSCEKPHAQNTHTVYESVECHPEPRPTVSPHVVLESVETGCISPCAQNTHTALEYIECHKECEHPCPTHVVIESVDPCKSKPSSAHTHIVYESIESHFEPIPSRNTHTVYESIESHCESNSCVANTHTVYKSVEAHCESSNSCAANTHTVYETVESHCESSCGNDQPTCGEGVQRMACPTSCSKDVHTVLESVESHCESNSCAANAHTVLESVESHCKSGNSCVDNTHTVLESVESHCESRAADNTHTVLESVESHCESNSAANTHTVIEAVETGCASSSACAAPKNTHTAYEYVDCNGCKSHVVLESIEVGAASCKAPSAQHTHSEYVIIGTNSNCEHPTHVVLKSVESSCASKDDCERKCNEPCSAVRVEPAQNREEVDDNNDNTVNGDSNGVEDEE
ncbi:hypothetical protein BX070DRAFT_253907 [Coemansia spiralis]|nr:hypothetical protein BX070DRAFT_253907 [Coemansia spiralis]